MAVVDPQKIYKDLEQQKFSSVYLFFGDEPYLLDQIPDRFKYSVLNEMSYDFNFSLFYAGESDLSMVRDTVETFPVMAPKRLVILKNVHLLKDSDWSELASLFQEPVGSTVFVLIGEKLDKRKKGPKLAMDKAVCAEFKRPYDNEVPRWINYLAQNYELKINKDAIHRLHRLVGNNLTELDHQVQKIKNYIGDKNLIEISDVNQVVSSSKEESVFDFTKAIGQKDRVLALEQLVNLLDQGQSEVGIVSLVARHMRILLTVRSGMDQGIGGAKLASIAQVPAYFIDGYCDQAKHWPVRKIEDALVVLSETDKALKSSPLSSHIWLENMVLKSCSL